MVREDGSRLGISKFESIVFTLWRMQITNYLYDIVEWFSPIHECKYGKLNHVKTSCLCVWIILSLCSWINMFTLKLLLTQQLVSNTWLKIFLRTKEKQAYKSMIKGILIEDGVNCSLVRMWYKKVFQERWKI